VRHFVESVLCELRETWMRRMSYVAVVQCCCDRPCHDHSVVRCQAEDCLHFLNLDQCLANKVRASLSLVALLLNLLAVLERPSLEVTPTTSAQRIRRGKKTEENFIGYFLDRQTHTHTHTSDRVLYLDHKVVNKW